MSPSDSFDFINDIPLWRKIIDAIEMTAVLYLNLQQKTFSSLVSKELRQVIILYNASIVEALLLHLYKREDHSVTKPNYINIQNLSRQYQQGINGTAVIATKVDSPRSERELMLDILVKYFNEQHILTADLKGKIDSIRAVRNTFHLSKSRKGIGCGQLYSIEFLFFRELRWKVPQN